MSYEMDDVIKKIKLFISKLIIKDQNMADRFETSKYSEDVYYYMISNKISDWTVLFDRFSFTEDEQIVVGIEKPFLNKDSIPTKYREKLVSNKVNKIKSEYVEYNDYYRMLNAEPEISKIDLSSNIDNIRKNKVVVPRHAIKVNLYGDTEKYLWELDENEKSYFIENKLDNLISYRRNSSMTRELYLEYMKTPINYYTARKADHLHIIYFPKDVLPDVLERRFIELYYQNLHYVMRTMYNDYYKNQDYYVDFLIIVILFMTIQSLIAERILVGTRRDFFDLESIQAMFESYNLPFFNEVPINFQRKILKNINRFLQYKGTDKVVVDIVNLFGFEDVNVFRYFLIKSNNELKFAKSLVGEKNITTGLKNESYYEDYFEVTDDDPYWGDEEDNLYRELSEMEFNYMSSKYISIDTMKDIYKTNIDVTYFFTTLEYYQSKGLLNNLNFKNTSIKKSGSLANMYDVFVAVYILTCWKQGYEDLILYDGTSYGEVYGFNFDIIQADLEEELRYLENLNEYKELTYLTEYIKTLDPASEEYRQVKERIETLVELEDYSKVRQLIIALTEDIMTPEDLMVNLFNNHEYKEYLEDLLKKAPTLKIKQSLQKIYDATMYTKFLGNVLGYGYETYSEYLQVKDLELYNFVKTSGNNKEDMDVALNTLFEALNAFIDDENFIIISDYITNNTVDLRKYLMTILSVFKAYTVDIKRLNTYLIFNNHHEDRAYMFFELHEMKKKVGVSDRLELLKESYEVIKRYYKSDSISVEDYYELEKCFINEENIDLQEVFSILEKSFTDSDLIKLKETLCTEKTITEKDCLVVDDALAIWVCWLFKLSLSEKFDMLNLKLKKSDFIQIRDKVHKLNKSLIVKDDLSLEDDFVFITKKRR